MHDLDPVTAYAEAVTRDKDPIPAGPHVRGACRRHLADLEHAHERGLYFSPEAAELALGFFPDVLRLNSGEFEGQPFELLPWQAFIVGSLFGWLREDGTRRFRTAFIETAKGSGKTPLCAGIGLKMLCADGESRAEIYAAAYNHDQATVLFRNAVAMVEQSPALSSRLDMAGGAEKTNISYLPTSSFFRPISSERQGRGKSGPIPHCGLLDEIHEHATNATVEFLDAGKKHRQQPLILMITNSGSDRNTVCWDYHQYACDLADGLKEDDAFFSYVCALDKDDEPFKDESCWPKANPSLPTIPGYDYIREQVAKARGIPSKESLVRRLNFCQWTDAAASWISGELWLPAVAEIDIEDYAEFPCWGGLDMSLSSDLTALVLAFEYERKRYAVFSWFWMPGDRLVELQDRDNMAPRYQEWRDKGYLQAPPGKGVIDYEHFAGVLEDICDRFDVRAIAYDRKKVELLEVELSEDGAEVPLARHGQGFFKDSETGLWMPSSIAETEAALTENRLIVNANPVLNWNVASTVTVASAIAPEDKRFCKRKATGRIDGSVALVQAIGCAAMKPNAKTMVAYRPGQMFGA